MKTKSTSKTDAIGWVSTYAETLRSEAGITIPGFRPHSEDRKVRRIFWRRAAVVQAAYDNAPAGAEAIAAAVWRKIRSFRPKLTAWGMDELISSQFRMDVLGILLGKVAKIRAQERQVAQAADDARRLQRATQAKRGRKGARNG